LSDQLEILLAKQAITEVLYRYCHAVDRRDAKMAATIWHPDGVAHYEGIFDGTGQEFMDWCLQSMASMDGVSHQLTNVLIEVNGDRATSESYVHACERTAGTDIIVYGRYSDTWSRRAGEWRIDERRYRHDVVWAQPAGEPLPAMDPAERP
jgi:ketosteroid isomerase-like protein